MINIKDAHETIEYEIAQSGLLIAYAKDHPGASFDLSVFKKKNGSLYTINHLLYISSPRTIAMSPSEKIYAVDLANYLDHKNITAVSEDAWATMVKYPVNELCSDAGVEDTMNTVETIKQIYDWEN